MRTHPTTCAAALLLAATAHAEVIRFDPLSIEMRPGERARALVLLDESVTPLFGYSLDVQLAGLGGASGLAINIDETNFFDARNLITAAGEARDPVFSIIRGTPDGGVFISTNTESGMEVLAHPDVNDVLAELVFDAAPDALGDFEITLGTGTALSTALGEPVPFTPTTLTINVVPAPPTLTLLCLLGLAGRRRLPTARRCG